MLHKLSIEKYHRQNADETDRGHITTILEHDDANRPVSDHTGLSFTDTARSMLDEYDASKGLSSADSMGSQRNLPRVKTSRTADHAVQVAIAGDRRNSLPDLGSRRAPKPRTAFRKTSAGPVRLDSQVWPAGSPTFSPHRTTVRIHSADTQFQAARLFCHVSSVLCFQGVDLVLSPAVVSHHINKCQCITLLCMCCGYIAPLLLKSSYCNSWQRVILLHKHSHIQPSARFFQSTLQGLPAFRSHPWSNMCVMQTSSAVTTPSTRPMRTTVGSLASWLMAYTMMQPGASGGRNGTTSKFDNDQEISAVSVLDDDGASGVGAAAAAAVSVALARSWAAAASQKQAAMVERTTSGSLKPGRAGFRLVAAVSNTDLVRPGGSNKRSTYDPEVQIWLCVAVRQSVQLVLMCLYQACHSVLYALPRTRFELSRHLLSLTESPCWFAQL